MKRYYCPYCGERSLSAHQKFAGKSGLVRQQKQQTSFGFPAPAAARK